MYAFCRRHVLDVIFFAFLLHLSLTGSLVPTSIEKFLHPSSPQTATADPIGVPTGIETIQQGEEIEFDTSNHIPDTEPASEDEVIAGHLWLVNSA